LAGLRATNEPQQADLPEEKNREFSVGASDRDSETKVNLNIFRLNIKL